VRWRQITVTVAVAWFGAVAGGAAPARADHAPQAPRVLHRQLWDAYGLLRRAGMVVAFPSFTLGGVSQCWPRVAAQHPRAGSRIDAGATVTLELTATYQGLLTFPWVGER